MLQHAPNALRRRLTLLSCINSAELPDQSVPNRAHRMQARIDGLASNVDGVLGRLVPTAPPSVVGHGALVAMPRTERSSPELIRVLLAPRSKTVALAHLPISAVKVLGHRIIVQFDPGAVALVLYPFAKVLQPRGPGKDPDAVHLA